MSATTGELAALIARYAEIDATLTSAGMPFEVQNEDVRGESMLVYVNRPTSLGEILAAASKHGDHPCFIFGDGTRLSFAEVVRDVRRVAAGLAGRGIGRGDRVAICAPNRLEWLLTFWATISMGAVVVAMNGWWTGTEMQNALELTDPKLLVDHGELCLGRAVQRSEIGIHVDDVIPVACVLGGADRKTLYICVAADWKRDVVAASKTGRIEACEVEVAGAGRP